MRSIFCMTLLSVLSGCAALHWSNTWPFLTENPKHIRKNQPLTFEDCLTQLDSILTKEVKHNFKNDDSAVAVLKALDGYGGIGFFFIGLWHLGYEIEKAASPNNNTFNPYYDPHFPEQTPKLVELFSQHEVSDPSARLRIIFSCYYKKLNHQVYNWDYEIAKIKAYWINGNAIYSLSNEMKQREDSIVNAYDFQRMVLGDTVVCWLSRPPRMVSHSPNWYYLTGTVNSMYASNAMISVKLTYIQSDKKTNEFTRDGTTFLKAGDTLYDQAINWHNKRYPTFNYNQNSFWRAP